LDAPYVLAVGFLGARIDHALAALSHLAQRSGPPVILVSEDDCLTVCPPDIALDLSAGTRVSLWPLGESRLTSKGLHWSLDGLVLSPLGQGGTSNRADGPVRLTCQGACLLILPFRYLDELLTGLAVS
jgi:thiamine pyrophosphokinase